VGRVKLVTQDYGCGTSSSILDYGIQDVVVVSDQDYEHVFEVEDDLLFIGHDFLFFLWDTDEKLERWVARKEKWEHWIWCFERVDAIVPAWQYKSHLSLSKASKFCKRVLACDEDDCDKYGFDWLPQWASCRFYSERTPLPETDKILFSGQAGKSEYQMRNELLSSILQDPELKERIVITNTSRSLGWDDYIRNLMSHRTVVNPVGVLRALNTRAYEALYSGRILLQHTVGSYRRHEEMLRDVRGVLFFKDLSELRRKLERVDFSIADPDAAYAKNALYTRMRQIGVNIT
jgi:hypothetical protein